MSATNPTLEESIEWAERMAKDSFMGGNGGHLARLAEAARAFAEPIPVTAEVISEPSRDTAWIVAAILLARSHAPIKLDELPAFVAEIHSMMESA